MLKYNDLAKNVKKSIRKHILGVNNKITPVEIEKITDLVHSEMITQEDVFNKKRQELLNFWISNPPFTILWKSNGKYGIEDIKAINREYIKSRLKHASNFWVFATHKEAQRFYDKEMDIDLEEEVQEHINGDVDDIVDMQALQKKQRELVALQILPALVNDTGIIEDEVRGAFQYADEFIRQSDNLIEDENSVGIPEFIKENNKIIDN